MHRNKRVRAEEDDDAEGGHVAIAALAGINPFFNDARVDVVPTFRGRQVQVPKKVFIGDRGGLYYLNAKGKTVYLKAYQRDQCVKGTLQYDTGACNAGVRPRHPLQPATGNIQQMARPYGDYVPIAP